MLEILCVPLEIAPIAIVPGLALGDTEGVGVTVTDSVFVTLGVIVTE